MSTPGASREPTGRIVEGPAIEITRTLEYSVEDVWNHLAGTTLVFSQTIAGFEEMAPGVGPGREYYLDRLQAALDGTGVDAVEFAGYYPGQREHYTVVEGGA